MPLLNNAFVTEKEVRDITKQYYTSITNNKLCTKLRAIQLKADSSYLTGYTDNQLVRYQHIKAILEYPFLVIYKGNSRYYANGQILVGNIGNYSFSDISNPNYGDFTTDADYWWELSLSNPTPGETVQTVSYTASVEICLLFPRSNFYNSNYGTEWYIKAYSIDAGANKISGSDFSAYECNGYVVLIYQGKLGTNLTNEIVVEFNSY